MIYTVTFDADNRKQIEASTVYIDSGYCYFCDTTRYVVAVYPAGLIKAIETDSVKLLDRGPGQ